MSFRRQPGLFDLDERAAELTALGFWKFRVPTYKTIMLPQCIDLQTFSSNSAKFWPIHVELGWPCRARAQNTSFLLAAMLVHGFAMGQYALVSLLTILAARTSQLAVWRVSDVWGAVYLNVNPMLSQQAVFSAQK